MIKLEELFTLIGCHTVPYVVAFIPGCPLRFKLKQVPVSYEGAQAVEDKYPGAGSEEDPGRSIEAEQLHLLHLNL